MRSLRSISSLVSLLVASLMLSGCHLNPETGRTQLRLLPASQVAAMGMEAKPGLIDEYGGEVESPELRAYIDQIGRRLSPHVAPEFAHIQWDFIVLDSDVINAFALPGGNVFLSRGLLQRFTNEAQVAAVLGHEIGHVTGQHVDERISQAVVLQGLVVATGVATAGTDSELARAAPIVIGGAGTGFLLKFGRDQELEADALGMRYMVAAGYDPQGMVQVLEILRDAAGGASPPEILSTHPDPGRRIRDAQRQIDERYAHTRNSPEYQLHEARFQQQARPHLGSISRSVLPVGGCWCSGCAALASAQ
jgi:predicted Zn-dependent protease